MSRPAATISPIWPDRKDKEDVKESDVDNVVYFSGLRRVRRIYAVENGEERACLPSVVQYTRSRGKG